MMKKISKKNRKILKVAIALTIAFLVSLVIYFVLKANGLTNIIVLRKFISNFGTLSILMYVVIRVIFTLFLSFIPSLSMILDLVAVALFGLNFKAFGISLLSVVLSSVLLDLIGRFGGSKLIIKLVGKEDYEKALDLLETKGEVYVPIMYLLPIFPDDAICMISGMTKMNFWLHLVYIVVCRGIGVATTIFGIEIIPDEIVVGFANYGLRYIMINFYQVAQLLTFFVFWIIVIFKLARRLDKKLTDRKQSKKQL